MGQDPELSSNLTYDLSVSESTRKLSTCQPSWLAGRLVIMNCCVLSDKQLV